MNGYFLAIIIIYALSLGSVLSKHGNPSTGKYNFWSTLISVLLMSGLIYMAIKTGF